MTKLDSAVDSPLVDTSVEPGASASANWREAFKWRINRLRCMSVAEVAHRFARVAQAQREQRRLSSLAPAPAARLASVPAPWIGVPSNIDPAPYLRAAKAAIAGRYDVFALRNAALGTGPQGAPDWNRDPRTGIVAPLTFGKTLNYRDERLVGDIKYLWEPSRHLHIVTLAQAWSLSAERSEGNRYFQALKAHLESWFDAAPYPLGVHWSSSLESGLRLINWSIAWQLLGGAGSTCFASPEGMAFRERWLESVYRHSQFVRGHFSLHSSANNHLLGEAAGLFIAALTWPCWEQSAAWEQAARELLEEHGLAQNAPDGVNREQAISYQQFTFDLLLLSILTARAAGRPLTGALNARLEAMLEFLASIMDVGGHLPMFGDSDDAFATRLAPQPGFCRYRSLLATGAVLFRRPEFKAKAGTLDDKTRWLLGDEAQVRYDALDPSLARLPVRRAFPEGGYYVMGWDFEQPTEARVVVDAGPLGYRSIAAHGHADALSFTLSLGGREFLVDPGTYAYHTQEAWREYFRGTSAHNTVRIDETDQSEQGGKFLWLAKARARCDLWSVSRKEDVFGGWHDGYQRLADPVTHRRRIAVDKQAHVIRVRDRLEMKGRHRVELFFHFSEACSVAPCEGGYRITHADRELMITLPDLSGGRVTVYRGSSSPISGWVSRAFDEKTASCTLAWRADLHGDVELETVLIPR